jgi:hypothetical protein
MMKQGVLIGISSMVLAFLIISAVLNGNSLTSAKNACIDNNKTPTVEKSFLAFNWSVSCE